MIGIRARIPKALLYGMAKQEVELYIIQVTYS